jgi:hypothetical protein
MGLIDILNHLLNFTAPALFLAIVTAIFARHLLFRKVKLPDFRVLAAVSCGTSLLVSGGALWALGRDGQMVGYAATVLACATSQWLMARGWRD